MLHEDPLSRTAAAATAQSTRVVCLLQDMVLPGLTMEYMLAGPNSWQTLCDCLFNGQYYVCMHLMLLTRVWLYDILCKPG